MSAFRKFLLLFFSDKQILAWKGDIIIQFSMLSNEPITLSFIDRVNRARIERYVNVNKIIEGTKRKTISLHEAQIMYIVHRLNIICKRRPIIAKHL